MRIAPNALAAALVAVCLPELFPSAQAAERGPILVNDRTGQTVLTLDSGDTVTVAGPAGVTAIDVSGAGNAVRGDNITVTAGTPTSHQVLGLQARAGGRITVSNSAVTSHGTAWSSHAVTATGAGSLITLNNSQIATRDSYSTGVRAMAGGRVVIDGGSVSTGNLGSDGLAAEGAGAVITAANVAISTRLGTGVSAQDGGRVTLTDSTVNVGGDSYGLLAQGVGATLTVINSDLQAPGSSATGLVVGDRATVTLDRSRITMRGSMGYGVQSSLNDASHTAAIGIANGSQIDLYDGTGLRASGGNHVFNVSDSTITARTAGNASRGLLLLATSRSGVATGQVVLDATRSVLSGTVQANEGIVDIRLKSASTLTGAVTQRGAGKVGSLTLDGDSRWNVNGNSTLVALTNAGTVAMTAPANGAAFKTLTVQRYTGGGTLVLNTRQGDDASATDKLVIDGGAATGQTTLRVLNTGGAGGQTGVGIRLVQTLNGGTTAPDAFHLDPGSTGYRATTRTLALNGYDYSLVRGGNGGTAPDWYLTSAQGLPPPDPPVIVDPVTPPVTPPGGRLPRNVSPESGAYLGNQLASLGFFTHGANDRNAVHDNADATRAGTGRRVWTRIEGRRDDGPRLSQGRVNIAADSAVLQWGADLLKVPLAQDGALHAGLMGGYASARSRSTATLTLPGGATAHARAHGKVSGYAAGVYATAYQHALTRLGAYADTWLQAARYGNQVDSDVGSVRYRSTVVSASIEAGYALAPFASGSPLSAVVLEPHAQLVYSRHHAQDATLQGTRMRSGNDNAWNSRIGVRAYPLATAAMSAVRPFLEANWLHRFNVVAVRMGGNTFDAAPSRDALELKLGAETRATQGLQLSGHVFGQAGNSGQRGYGGMVNAGYRW